MIEPLGISTGLIGAAILNLGTEDNQRGFFIQGFVGIPWAKSEPPFHFCKRFKIASNKTPDENFE